MLRSQSISQRIPFFDGLPRQSRTCFDCAAITNDSTFFSINNIIPPKGCGSPPIPQEGAFTFHAAPLFSDLSRNTEHTDHKTFFMNVGRTRRIFSAAAPFYLNSLRGRKGVNFATSLALNNLNLTGLASSFFYINQSTHIPHGGRSAAARLCEGYGRKLILSLRPLFDIFFDDYHNRRTRARRLDRRGGFASNRMGASSLFAFPFFTNFFMVRGRIFGQAIEGFFTLVEWAKPLVYVPFFLSNFLYTLFYNCFISRYYCGEKRLSPVIASYFIGGGASGCLKRYSERAPLFFAALRAFS